MILEPSSAVHLKPWLVRTLEPICDAEPGALADYILALLKHNVSEADMRKELEVQLEEFLEKECATFIDSLFNVLRSKSYLPYSDVPPPEPSSSTQADAGIPIPLDGLLTPSEPPNPGRGRKRNHEADDRDGRPPAKGHRINADGQFSRYGRGGHDSRSTGGWTGLNGFGGEAEMFGQMASMAAQMGMPGLNNQRNGNTYQPPEQKRGICRDYHNNGYCTRGATCKYSHGDDAMVPGMFGGMPLPFMFPGFPPFGFPGVAGGSYDPHEARMDMRPSGSGELPVIQDLTPADPSKQSGFQNQQAGGELQQQMDVDNGPGFGGDGQRHTRPLRGRGRGRGGAFGSEAQSVRPQRRDGKTLVIEKIPDDKLSQEQIIEWFKRFGSVTNVAVDRSQAKALVSFSNHEEAYAAWKSEEAVFGNRFVKLFWHRPLEGQGQTGTKALAASAPMVARMASKEAPSPPTSRPVSKNPSTMDASTLAAQQSLLEQQISEQKLLMASLSTASPEEKKNIMARLRKLGEEMKKPSIPSGTSKPDSSTSTQSKEEMQKELLDKELEMHSAGGGESEESTESLKAKLEKLKAEAASLGITDTGAEPAPYAGYGGYRPYRGRARGFRGYRGGARGGPPRASMKLDNRPKKLLVKDTPDSSSIRAWFEAAGQVDSFETSDSGDLVIGFKSRAAAEQALAKGSNIPDVGQITLTWYTGATKPSEPQNEATNSNDSAMNDVNDEDFREASPARSHHDEELNVSRWGDDDGEDRM